MDTCIYKNIIEYSFLNFEQIYPKFIDSYTDKSDKSDNSKYIIPDDYNNDLEYRISEISHLEDPMNYDSLFNLSKSIVFANLDSIVNFTSSKSNLCIVNINEIPGSFIEYFNYKNTSSLVYAVGNRMFGEYDLTKIPNYNLKRFYGSNNTGNLNTIYPEFVRKIQSDNPLGVDLVYAGKPKFTTGIGLFIPI